MFAGLGAQVGPALTTNAVSVTDGFSMDTG